MSQQRAEKLAWIRLLLLSVCAVAVGGCSEAVVRQYTRLGQWTHPADAPRVLSGTPDADQAALNDSQQTISEAEWDILEKIAPRPIWQRIAESRLRKMANTGQDPGSTTAPARKVATSTRPRPTPADVADYARISTIDGGRLRIYCPLRYYGGVTATSTLDGGTDRRRINRTPADFAPVLALVNGQLGEKGNCVALPAENTLVVTCAPEMKETILKLLAEIDSPPRQVEITARIFEVSHEFDFQLGAHSVLKHLAGDQNQSLTSNFSTRAFLDSLTNTAMGDVAFQGSALRLMQVFGNSGITVDVTFQALADTGFIKEIASPRMTVVAGQTGYMLAGQELPITSARISNDQLVTEKTTYKPIGVQLYITPQTIGDADVRLHVVTVVSSVSGFSPRMTMETTDSLQNLVNPILDSREAETSVTVPDGNTLVIGGLRMVRHITRERKIPGLGDIEWMQWLFKNHRSQRQLNDLYFFVTPRIVE